MSDTEKSKSILKWQAFSDRCQIRKAERAKIKERHDNRFSSHLTRLLKKEGK